MEKPKYSLDDHFVNLIYIGIEQAVLLLNIAIPAVKNMMLGETLTREQKNRIKKDLQFSEKQMQFLSQASASFKTMMSALNQIETAFADKIIGDLYDDALAEANKMVAVNIMYLSKVVDNKKAEEELNAALLNYGETDPDVKTAYRYFRRKAEKIKK